MSERSTCPACGVPWVLPTPHALGEGEATCPACGARVQFRYWRRTAEEGRLGGSVRVAPEGERTP